MINFFSLKKYCTHLFRARKGKKAHSPFLYHLSIAIFDNKKVQQQYQNCIFGNDKFGLLTDRMVAYFDMRQIIVFDASLLPITHQFDDFDANKKPCNMMYFNSLKTFTQTSPTLNADMILIKKNCFIRDFENDFEKIMKYTHNDTVLIYENIYGSPETENIWKQIKSHKKVTVTLDLYRIGIVFFRKESSKENFILKY